MTIDRFTGKSLDRPSDNLSALNGRHCKTCGTGIIDRCQRCGAPQCCPKCCADDYAAWLEVKANPQNAELLEALKPIVIQPMR